MTFPFTGVDPDTQKAMSLDRAIKYVQDFVEPYSPYYRELFRRTGIEPGTFRSYEDFRKIPITYKEDVARQSDRFVLSPGMPGEANPNGTATLSHSHWESYREYAKEPKLRDLFFPRLAAERMKEAFCNEWLPVHFQSSGGSTGKSLMTAHTLHDVTANFAPTGAWLYTVRPVASQREKAPSMAEPE